MFGKGVLRIASDERVKLYVVGKSSVVLDVVSGITLPNSVLVLTVTASQVSPMEPFQIRKITDLLNPEDVVVVVVVDVNGELGSWGTT
jgi:hypothetical protein